MECTVDISYRNGSVEVGNMVMPIRGATLETYESLAEEFAESNRSLMKRSTHIVFKYTGDVHTTVCWVM